MKRYTALLFSLLVTMVFLGASAFAATVTSAQSGNWSATTTWAGGVVPSTGDAVIINGGFAVTVDIPNASCLTLQLGGSTLGTGSGTLTFAGGSQLLVAGLVTLGVTNNTPGSITMTAGGTLTCEGFLDTRLGTWTAGTGTIVLTATNTIPANNNVDFNNLVMSGGTTTVSRNVSVTGNLTINLGATLDGGANILTLSGDWTNNGTFTGNTGTITFAKNGNQVIAGTGTNNFNLLRVNMGLSIANTLEVVASNFNAPDAFLTLANGTFKVSGSFTFANSFLVGPIYNIQPTAGFWINNPNVTVTAQAGGVSVRGLLRLSAGTYNIGTATDHSLDYVAGSSIIIDGGVLNIAGRLSRNSPASTTSYTQSGGTVSVVGQGSTDPVFAGFDLGVAGSSFTMSGGTIVIGNATSAPADYLNLAGTANVTGGTLQIGNAGTGNASVIRIQTSRPIGSLVVSNATSQIAKPTAQLVGSSLNVLGGVSIQAGTILNTGGLNLSLGGDLTDNGTFTNAGSTVTFNGSGAQALTKAGVETFENLAVSKPGGTLALGSSVTVNIGFSLSQGTLAVGTNTLTLNGPVSGGGTLTSGVTGSVSYNQGSPGQTILAGNYGNLFFSNFNKILPSSGVVGVSGTFTPGAAAGHTITGSVFDFNGASQNVPPFTYNGLTLSGSGTKTGSGTITVNGNFTNQTGIVFTGTNTLSLAGPSNLNAGTLSAGTITVGPGGSLSNLGTVTSSLALNGSGVFTQGPTGILNIGGTVGITTLNAGVFGNTVSYTGVVQTVAPVTYHHLTLSGGGPITLNGVSTINGNFTLSGAVNVTAATGLTVGGNFSIAGGTLFDAGPFVHTVNGNLSIAGTFTPGISTFVFAGSAPQTVNGATFSGVVISNPIGVSMLGDITVGNTLRLNNGAFSIGTHTLTLNGDLSPGAGSLFGDPTSNLVLVGSAPNISLPGLTLNSLTLNRVAGATLTGSMTISNALTIVNGTLASGANTIVLGPAATISEPAGQPVIGFVRTTRDVSAVSGTESFGGIGVDILLKGAAPGSTTVLRTTGSPSVGSAHTSITRHFDITPTVNTGLNAGLVFHYDPSEVVGQNAAALELYRSRDNGTSWNNLGGTVNTVSRTISAVGLNDLSRWTASDTTNRIGATAAPTITVVAPASKTVGNPAFTLTVNGTEFVNGKSTIRLDGSNRTTTYINSTHLTAAIPATDLLTAGTKQITVFTADGGGSSISVPLVVDPIPPSKVAVETAPDGSGTIVAAQSLASGSSITLYAISRDSLNTFFANVAADTWSLQNVTGGTVAGDLVPSVDRKSAVFIAHLTGSASIKATSGVLVSTASGTITVTAGSPTKVRVETAANGTGTVVAPQSVASGSSITMFAITRDSLNNFVANAAADVWSLQNITGGVVAGDLAPAVDKKSAVFTGHASGSAVVRATSGVLAVTGSGTITVTPGIATKVQVESAADGSGIIVPIQTLASGSALTVYAISRDSLNNFIANVAADAWNLLNATGGVVPGDLAASPDRKSALFTGHIVGSAMVRATSGTLGSIVSGTITVSPGTSAKVRVESASDGSGVIVPAQSVSAGSSITVFAITRDSLNNFVANAAADSWSLQNSTGGIVPADLAPSVDRKSAIFTGHAPGSTNIRAASGVLAATTSGTITVTTGIAVKVRVETAADGSGTIVPAQSLVSGSSITLFAVTRDSLNNFIANVAADTWGLQNITGGVVSGDLVPAVDRKSAVFTGHLLGTALVQAVSGSLTTTASGIITVTSSTGVTEQSLPATFALMQNYPNPFNPSTQIKFDVPSGGQVSLIIYDVLGRQIVELAAGFHAAGHYSATWNASGVASGVYFARFVAIDGQGNVAYSKVNRLMLMK